MAQVLILSDEQKALIKRLKDHAEANPLSFERVKSMHEEKEPAIGNDPNFRVELPIGIRIVYSVEQQEEVTLRHISVSIAPGKLPNMVLFNMLLKEFGFAADGTKGSTYWIEGKCALNFVEEM